MLKNISFEQTLFILSILFLPINRLRIPIPLVGYVLSNFLLLIGLFFFTYKILTNKEKLEKTEFLYLYYIAVFFMWMCICSVLGIYEFSYYDKIWLEQIDKLRNLLQTLQSMNIEISDSMALKVWLGIRVIKNCVLRIFLTYGISVWIYHIYQNNKLNHTRKNLFFTHAGSAVLVLCFVMIVYSVFEIGYLRGNLFCANLLTVINPILYEAQKNNGWWPPLLWKGQLRSLFVEPSYFGIASTFIVPILFYQILKFKKNILIYGCYSMFVIMLYMTRARTALILFIIQGLLLFIYAFGFNQKYIKRTIKILCVSGLSFCFALFLMSGFKDVSSVSNNIENIRAKTTVSNYINDNILSVIGNKRSNSARFANVRATFFTGIQHPFFGVGIDLSSVYTIANFREVDLENSEVRDWFYYMEQDGIINSALPILNQLSFVMAQFGIPGLILYLLPVFYIFQRFFKMLKRGLSVEIACIFIAYMGSLIAMFSNEAFLPYYVLTGIMVSLLQNGKGEKDYDGNNRCKDVVAE